MKNYFEANKHNLNIAVDHLKKGNLIIHSTDTIPGLAADATNNSALKKLINLKGRPGPYSIIIQSVDSISKYAILGKGTLRKIKNLLPGPFTILLKNNNRNNLSNLTLGGSELVGFRVPNHKFTNQLVTKFKSPIITTSLNLTGEESIINLEKISEHFKELVIFDDKKRNPSKGSTILDFSSDNIKLIRKGDGDYAL